ncbi:hypothetical protein HHK36_000411 [Tetracentron sinense]|uniref:non-specific serine/threonine protein kinase n=1 Tax=Tetracentron sinense TaxID=13715 RepID=A0A835A1L0_TETSI|nr:hypothetical protein HHK36_000411 [Tetracentron sinense]
MASAIPHFIFFFFLLLLSPFAIAQTYRNVSIGSSLSAIDNDNSSWASPSGEFAFGFRPIGDKDLFLLAIWFDKIPDKTIVWSANGDNLAPKGSRVELVVNDLVLNDPQGKEIWKAEFFATEIIYAAMLSTGNFVLVNRNGYIWESFKQPTDTILPTQILEVNGMLSSRQAETNYSKGRFQLRLLSNGNLVLNPIGRPTYDFYYSSSTNESDPVDSSYQVLFNDSGYINIVSKNGGIIVNLTKVNTFPIADYYYRATMDFDGLFTQYAHPRTSNGNQSWSIVWSIPNDICSDISGELGSGVCGYNSYCLLNSERRPSCNCPPEYSLINPNDKFSGCKPNFALGCGVDDESRAPEDVFEFRELSSTNWPPGNYEQLGGYSEEECKKSCLQDCFCAVAIFRTRTRNCWKKRLPLSNGRRDSSEAGTVLFKVRKVVLPSGNPHPPTTNTKKKKDQTTSIIVLSLLLGMSLLVVIYLIASLTFIKRSEKPNHKPSVLETNLRSFSYEELKESTNGFKEELGRGSFGIVYKGFLGSDSRNLIAVKKLDKVVQEGEKEFKAEVSAIGQTNHKNLVRLLGFCEQGPHRLLVYEFMSNEERAILTDWAYECFITSRLVDLVESDEAAMSDMEKLKSTNESNRVDSSYQVVFNNSTYINIVRNNGDILKLTEGNRLRNTDYYYRAAMDFDGLFTQYAHPRTSNGNQSWSIVWTIPNDICSDISGELGSGVCGFNSNCLLNSERRPSCECPPEYSFMEPNNKFGGCKPNFAQGSGVDDESRSPEDVFEFRELSSTNCPQGIYERLEQYNEEECKKSCLQDCFCAVAIIRARTRKWWKKRLPLSNGRRNSNEAGTVSFKVRISGNPHPPTANTTKKKAQTTLIIVLSLILKLKESTDGFKEELGRGSFGIVYKGFLGSDSRNLTAVKKLDKVVQEGEKEFKAEVSAIGQTNHKNLVRLLGFMSSGTLAIEPPFQDSEA